MIRTFGNYTCVDINGTLYHEDGDVSNAIVTRQCLSYSHTPFCVDIGADQGWWTRWILAHNSDATIHVFEPNPISYKHLEKDLGQTPQVYLHNVAVSTTNGTLPLYLEKGQSHSRVMDGKEMTHVPCVTLSSVLSDTIIDILKIDVEGHELQVFESIRPWIESGRVNTIITEFTPKWYGQTKDEQFQECMSFFHNFPPQFQEVYCLSRHHDFIVGPIKPDEYGILIDTLLQTNLQTDIVLTNISLCHSDISQICLHDYILQLSNRL